MSQDRVIPPPPRPRHRQGLGVLLLFLLLCLLWRLDYVPLLGMRSLPVTGVAAALAGSLWIDVLVATVLVLGWGVGGAQSGAQSGAPSGARSRAPRILGRLVLAAGFAWLCIARISDRAYYFYSGAHVDRIGLQHLQGNAFDMRLDARVLSYIAVATALAVLAMVLLLLAARAGRRSGLRPFAKRVLGPLAMLAVLGWAGSWVAQQVPSNAPWTRLQELQAAPEVQIPWLWIRKLESPPLPTDRLLHPVVKKKLRRFGILVEDSLEFPLIKEKVFQAPLPFPKTTSWTAKPNVIVLFFESFSTALTSVYGDRHPGLTPNLEGLARVSCVVEDFFNAATPTVTSLVCCYGSHLPVTSTQSWFAKENNSGNTRFWCLPHILRRHGWHTAHVHSLTNEFVRTGDAVARLGFQSVVDGPAIGRALGEPQAHWGFSDHQIFRYVSKTLQEQKLKQPFLLSVATVDSHAPFLPSKEGPVYGNGDNPLLSSIHSADHAFGTFWKWFQTSSYYANTIVVATADHAMFPGKEHAELRPDEDIAGRYFDRVMCLVHDPGHQLPPRVKLPSSQLDIAPTILHLLDINERNHFEGHSLFDDRDRYPGVLSMHEFLFGIYQPLAGNPTLWNFRREEIQDSCLGAHFDPAVDHLTRCEYFHYYQWKRSLLVNNRIWR